MEKYLEKFVSWAKLKIRLHTNDGQEIYFKEREIWWASLGVNVGNEQDGKNENFERPILVLKNFGGDTLWALPLTSQNKTGKFYYQFNYRNKKYSASLSQLRLISSKRLLRKIRTLSERDFEKLRNKLKVLI